MRLLPGTNQEHPGCIFLERLAGGGLIWGIRASDCDGEPPPRGIRGFKGGEGFLAGGQSGRLVVFSGHLGWGGALAPADCIRGPT